MTVSDATIKALQWFERAYPEKTLESIKLDRLPSSTPYNIKDFDFVVLWSREYKEGFLPLEYCIHRLTIDPDRTLNSGGALYSGTYTKNRSEAFKMFDNR